MKIVRMAAGTRADTASTTNTTRGCSVATGDCVEQAREP